jgi:hypothetical protein
VRVSPDERASPRSKGVPWTCPRQPDRDQCRRADVPFFFKQWGGTNKKRAGRLLEGRTWDEMPVQYLASIAKGRPEVRTGLG